MNIYQSFYFLLVFVPLHILFTLLQRLKWLLDGTWKKIEECQSNYERSAQVKNIIWRGRALETGLLEEGNFMCTHQFFTHPNYVLEDHVTLMTVTREHAYFTEHDPRVNINHSSTNCIVRFAQFEHAQRLIKIPIHHFHTLAEEVGEPKEKVIMLANHTRCGSTLVTQVLETSPGLESISEPQSMSTPIELFTQRKIGRREAVDLLRSCLYLLCKPIRKRKITAFCIKELGYSCGGLDIIYEALPNLTYIYLYRNGLPTLKSMFYVFKYARHPLFKFILSMTLGSKNNNTAFAWTMSDVHHDKEMEWFYDTKYLKTYDFKVMLAASLINAWRLYGVQRSSGIPINAIKYEDFLKDPDTQCRLIEKYCGIAPMDPKGPMSRDVQAGTPLSTLGVNKSKDPFIISDREKADIDYVCDRLKGPRFTDGQDLILPGTLGRDA